MYIITRSTINILAYIYTDVGELILGVRIRSIRCYKEEKIKGKVVVLIFAS